MTNAVDPNVRYWAELDREVRGLMDGATAEEAELSSDDEGAAEGLLGGETLSWSRARHSGAVYAEAPRAESRPAAAGDAFRSRLAAAFDALPAPSAIDLAKPGFVAKQQLMLVQAREKRARAIERARESARALSAETVPLFLADAGARRARRGARRRRTRW